jgi:transcriptional regulator with XRE-family HTH domain
MAEFLGMREQAYQKYEYGQREPNYDKLVKICRHLQISTDYLLGLSRDPVIRDPIVNEETVAQAI